MWLRILMALVLLVICSPLSAQTKWYKFDKGFIQSHFGSDGSAIGSLKVSAMHPAKNVHTVSCGGNDGELHIGIAESDLGSASNGHPVSAFAADDDSGFGIVAEPPNMKAASPYVTKIEGADGDAAAFYGYFRV